MATRARELWLILRARNEATGALRSAAGSFRALQRGSEGIAIQRQQVLNQIEVARRLRDQYRLQQQSLTTGEKALALDQARGSLLASRASSMERISRLESTAQRLTQARFDAEQKLATFQRSLRPTAGVMAAPGMTRAETAAQMTRLQTAVTAATHDEQANAEAMRAAAISAENLSVQEAKLAERELAQARAAELAGKKADEQAARMRMLGGRSRELYAQLQKVPIAEWQRFGQTLRNVGQGMVITGGAALAVMGMMARTAAEASKALTLAATQARPAGAGVQATMRIQGQLFNNVLRQMQRFPASSQEMAQSLYEIFSGTNVQNIGQATDMLKVFNQMAVAGGSDLKTMTDAGISLYNNFPGQFKNMTDAANQFFAVVRYGRMNADQFAKSLSYILPIAKEAGLSFQDVGGAMAFLTRQTGAIRTTQDAQGLARLIQLMGRNEFAQGMHNLGVEVFDAAGKMRPILDIITDLRGKTNMTNREVLNFFKTVTQGLGGRGTQGTIQAQRVFANIYEHAAAAQKVAAQTRKDTDEMIKSFRAMSRDPGVRWQVFQNQLHALAITIGRDLIPVFARIGEIVAKLAQWFQGLSPHTRRIIAEFTAWGAVMIFIGGVLTALAGALVGAFVIWKRFGDGLSVVRTMLGRVAGRGGMATVAEEAGFISARFSVLAGAVALLIPVLLHFHRQLGTVFDKLGGVKNILEVVIGLLTIKMVRAWGATAAAAVRSIATIVTAETALETSTVAATGRVNVLKNALLMLTRRVWPIVLIETIIHAKSLEDWMRKNALGFKQLDDFLKGKYDPSFLRRGPDVRQPSGPRGLTPGQITRGQQIIAGLPAGQRGMTPGQITNAWNAQQAGARKAAAAQRAASTSLEHFMRIFMRLRQLQAQFAAAPTIGLAKQIDTLQNKMKQASPVQQAYFQQLEQNLGSAKIISDSAALAMGRNVDRLRKAFERAPSTRTYQAWYQANKRFTTLATQDQQQFANDMVSAHQQALEKIKEAHKKAADQMKQDWQIALDFVRSLYQGFLQEMQQAFGQLGQGPFEKNLESQVQRIRDNGSKAAQALRDEAQRIQDSAQKAADNVSATTGNLMDWGLLPRINKSDIDRRVKELNDAADKLEKAANARADKLQKRLEQHKLTPKELLSDLRSQLNAFNAWNRHLNQLARRGAPRELVNQLRQLGPEYDNMLKGLLRMTPAQWRRYIHLFSAGQRAQHQAAMQQLQQQLRTYRRYGRGIVQAISKGIQDESPVLRRALIQLVRETFPGLGGRGGARRVQRQVRQVRRPAVRRTQVRRVRPTARQRVTHQPTSVAHYHYHADRAHHMSADAYFRKMHFRHRNQRRC